MPIKSSAFGETEAKNEAAKPAESQQEPTPGAGEETTPPKRKRRSKAELIEEATIPGNDDNVEVKFTSTGTVGERPWLVAVELFREDKVEFKDKSLKYAVLKMDQQKSGASDPDGGADDGPDGEQTHNAQELIASLEHRWSALQERLDETKASDTEQIKMLGEEAEIVRQEIIQQGGVDPESDKADEQRAQKATEGGADTGAHSGKKGDKNIPPDAEVGDEVVMGSETYRVGHGRVLTQGSIGTPEGEIIHAKTRWQRELGAGNDGPWESTPVKRGGTSNRNEESKTTANPTEVITTPAIKDRAQKAGVQVESTPVGQQAMMVDVNVWRIGTGVLEKIGLPEYSSLQIGPNTMSRNVLDDGRRTKTVMPGSGGREIVVPTAIVEAFSELDDTVEYVTRLQRQHLISFLEAVKPGSTQPS